MYKKIFFIFCLGLVSVLASAQQTMTAKEMVAISPMLSRNLDLPDDARSSLGTKLNQIVTQNGFGSLSGQFVLTANVVVIDKQVTATAPPQFIVELEVSVYVLNLLEELIIDETSFSVKGIDRLENKAIIQAINQIKPKSPTVRGFMDGCRTKIIDYYNTQVPTLLKKAQSLADRNQYEEALTVLSAIPETVDQYPVIADQMTAMYVKLLDRNATTAIQDAKGKMALKDYEGALEALLKVDPFSTKSKEAFAMIESIKQGIDAKEKAELEERIRIREEQQEAAQRAQDDKIALAKIQVQAAQKMGTESVSAQSGSLGSGLDKWFLGKFKK